MIKIICFRKQLLVVIIVNIKEDWEGCTLGRKLFGKKGIGKEGTDTSKHPAKSSNVSQAWANMDGSNPSVQGS